MNLDKKRIDEAVLALLLLGIHEGARVERFRLGLNESASREGIHIGSPGKSKVRCF